MTPTPAETLRAHRTLKGLTLRKLARKTGISAGHLCNLENGKLGFSHRSAYILSRYFKVGINRFLDNHSRDPQ